MMILLIILIVLVAAILLLRGEGGNYGKGNVTGTQEKKLGTSDRNYFL